jgi:hypothetical protein
LRVVFKHSRIATTVLAAAGAALAAASPAMAAPGSSFDPGLGPVPDNPWTHSAVAVCATDALTVPVGGATVGEVLYHCANGDVLAEVVQHAQG